MQVFLGVGLNEPRRRTISDCGGIGEALGEPFDHFLSAGTSVADALAVHVGAQLGV